MKKARYIAPFFYLYICCVDNLSLFKRYKRVLKYGLITHGLSVNPDEFAVFGIQKKGG